MEIKRIESIVGQARLADSYPNLIEERFAGLADSHVVAESQLKIRLRYYDEMPYDQMAALTGTSEGALKASYHHAMKKVTEELQRSE